MIVWSPPSKGCSVQPIKYYKIEASAALNANSNTHPSLTWLPANSLSRDLLSIRLAPQRARRLACAQPISTAKAKKEQSDYSQSDSALVARHTCLPVALLYAKYPSTISSLDDGQHPFIGVGVIDSSLGLFSAGYFSYLGTGRGHLAWIPVGFFHASQFRVVDDCALTK